MLSNNHILIVVDMQNDFVSGALAIPSAEELPAKIADKIQQFKKEYKKRGVVFFTLDTHESNYLNTREGKYLPIKHCIDMTPGWCIVDELFDLFDQSEPISKKDFAVHGWENIIRDVYKIEPVSITICGVATDICVVSNAIILRQIFGDIPIRVYADLCAGTTPELHKAALDVMRSCQIEIV